MDPQEEPKALVIAKGFPPYEIGGVETYSEEVFIAHGTLRETELISFGDPSGGNGKKEFIRGSGNDGLDFFRLLARLIHRDLSSYGVIHCTTWKVATPLLLLAFPSKLVVTAHGNEFLKGNPFLRFLMHRVYRRASQILCVSDFTRNKLLKVCPDVAEKLVTSWNAPFRKSMVKEAMSSELDRSCKQVEDGKLSMYSVCRLEPKKNIELCIRAARNLVDKGYTNFSYKVAGDGSQFDHLRSLVEELRLEEHVSMLGRVDDTKVQELHREGHIFLHPQIMLRSPGGDMQIEGFGIVIADAMHHGAVAIAGAEGGPSDFITSGKNGYLVSGRSVEELTALLLQLHTGDPRARAAIANNAIKTVVEGMSWLKHLEPIYAGE